MHPELLNNSLFLRYYGMWQKDPTSVVFTSVADFFLKYGLVEDAFKICEEGLKNHPNLVTGKIIMAKIYFARNECDEAERELAEVIKTFPNNKMAVDLLSEIRNKKNKPIKNLITKLDKVDEVPDTSSKWHTVTMAKIYADQGHIEKAREVYHSVLKRDPGNEEARIGLESIRSIYSTS